MAEERRFEYWDIKNPPLLLHGFTRQTINAPAVISDKRLFQLEVNRGVVVAIDYSAVSLAILAAPMDEALWNDAVINCDAGGQELIQGTPADHFDYNIDLGNETEQKIWTWLNGGQVIESELAINAATLSTTPIIQIQMHAYYSTEALENWRKSFRWKNGVGLKQKTFAANQTILPGEIRIENVLPKNQGKIVGFSILYLSVNAVEATVNLSIDGLMIIKEVHGERFSRFWQRDPFIFLIPLMPGSSFLLSANQPNIGANPGRILLTFYFDN